jgi:hypothetical protein
MTKNKKNKFNSSNNNLKEARKNKNDEFYTQRTDIEKELKYYKNHFNGKTVFCNCDDPEWSNFWKFFYANFNLLGLKKLISTHYIEPNQKEKEKAYKIECVSVTQKKGELSSTSFELKGNGDFRSQECIELLKEADIVVTNPPFSLFREYVAQLIKYDKQFCIIGNMNAITYKEIFKLIKENKIWLGHSIHSGDREFRVPDYYPLKASGNRIDENGNKYIRVKGVRWFTNIDYKERHEDLILYRKYKNNEMDYHFYDDYEVINIDKTKDIPMDYEGLMGVPISFLDKYNPNQFEILGLDDHRLEYPKWRGRGPDLNGKPIYRRIIIKHRKW